MDVKRSSMVGLFVLTLILAPAVCLAQLGESEEAAPADTPKEAQAPALAPVPAVTPPTKLSKEALEALKKAAVAEYLAEQLKLWKDEKKAIRKAFDEKPDYDKYFDYPLCKDVYDKITEEVIAIQQAHNAFWGSDPEVVENFSRIDVDFPSLSLQAKTKSILDKMITIVPTPETQAKLGIDATPVKVRMDGAFYFAADTPIYRLKLDDKSEDGETVDISEIVEGDFVLSSTAYIEEDSRYHEVCWAEVKEVMAGAIPAGQEMAWLQYEGRNGADIEIKGTTDICVYCRQDASQPWCVAACKDKSKTRRSMLLTTTGEDSFFQVLKKRTADTEFAVYNLIINRTGSYFVGESDSEILIHN